MSTGAMSPPAGDPNMGVTKVATSGVTAHRLAVQIAEQSIGLCHRQALWCGAHADVWPHGQHRCNTFTTATEAATALLESRRGW